MTSPTAAGMEPFHGLEINALARALEAEGRDIAFLEQGQPAAPPAPRVIEAVRGVLDGPQRYTHFAGMPALRAALARYYREQHGVAVSEDSIIATMSSSSGFILAFLGGFAPGAKIAVTRPGYTAYLNTLYGMGYRPVEIPVSAAEGWHLTPAAIAAAHAREPFAGLLLASPANPTGAAVDRTQLGEIVAVCARLGVRFISDEIYHGLDYRGPSVSALEFTRDAIVINSFSKYYCMTGWRIGWMVLPESDVRAVERLSQSLYISAPELSQRAAIEAFHATAELERIKDRYRENRAILLGHLPRMGLALAAPMDGAFYAYCDVSRFTNDSMEFARRMIAEIDIAATPGRDFDPLDGHRTMRFSYAGKVEEMREAVRRLENWLPHQKA